MAKKQLLVTFNYGLFLGEKSGEVEACMLRPTTAVAKVLAPFEVRAIFFADIAHLLRLKEVAPTDRRAAGDFQRISEQLQELQAIGHYIFPQIHPHWLDAKYILRSNQWSLKKLDKFRFHHIKKEVQQKLFADSCTLLSQILSTAEEPYQPNGFRAGGCSIQPFSDFKPHFQQMGIDTDFSVLSGGSSFTNAQYYDFNPAPEKPVYLFNEDITVENSNGPFTEMSISTIQFSLFTRLMSRWWDKYIWNRPEGKAFGRGEAIVSRPLDDENGADKSISNSELAAVEMMTSVKLPEYVDFIKKHDYMQLMSHPKNINRHNLKVFERFLNQVYTKFEVETDYRFFLDAPALLT